MNKSIKIFLCTIIVFIFFGAGLFTYYSIYERKDGVSKYVEKSIDWDIYKENKPLDKIRLYNMITKSYDEYLLDDVNYDEINIISKEIIKEVKEQSNIKLEKKDFPEKIKYDNYTLLTLINTIVEPNYIKENQWHEELEIKNKIYSNILNADLFNIPKEIYDNNETWFLLTDKVKFESIENLYNCTASYFRVKRVEEEKTVLDGYNIKAIYSGKLLSKTGNVKLKYKLRSQNTNKVILPYFSIKILFITIILMIVIFILHAKQLTRKS